MKYDESPQTTKNQPGIEQTFLWAQQVFPYRPTILSTHAPKSMKIIKIYKKT